MLNQILFIFWGLILDNSNIISLPKPKFETIRIMNYCVWSSVALYSLYYDDIYVYSYIFITNTIIGNYIYELIFHTPDMGHFFHHVCTIIAMVVGYASNIYIYNWAQHMSLINFVALSSSIFSSLRRIEYLRLYKYELVCFYKCYYVVAKSIAILFHYWIFYNNWTRDLTYFENLTAVIFFIVHITQIYFIFIIVKN
jgi:hypothetical protein